jgi:hypothetical protein
VPFADRTKNQQKQHTNAVNFPVQIAQKPKIPIAKKYENQRQKQKEMSPGLPQLNKTRIGHRTHAPIPFPIDANEGFFLPFERKATTERQVLSRNKKSAFFSSVAFCVGAKNRSPSALAA